MIRTFRDSRTREVFTTGKHRDFGSIAKVAKRKLDQINEVPRLADLNEPPGNRLEALTGGRAGQHSIRVNDQFRICFEWQNGDVDNVEIVDYH